MAKKRFEIIERDGRHIVVDRIFPPNHPHRERAEFAKARLARAWITREKKLIRDAKRRGDPCPR